MKSIIKLAIVLGIGIVLILLTDRIDRLVHPADTMVIRDTLRIHIEAADSARITRRTRLGIVKPGPDIKIMPMNEYHALLASINLADTIHIQDTVTTAFPVAMSAIDTTVNLTIRDSLTTITTRIQARAVYTFPPLNRHELEISLLGAEIVHTEKAEVKVKAKWYNVLHWTVDDWKRGTVIAGATLIGLSFLKGLL